MLKDIVIETAQDGTGYVRVGSIIAIVCVAVALILAIYVIRSVAIFKMAKNNGKSHAFLAWIPFAWLYLASNLCVKPNVLGRRINRFALMMVLVYSICIAIIFVYEFLLYYPLVKYWLEGGVITIYEDIRAASGTQYFSNSGIFLEAGYSLPYKDTFAMSRFLSVLGVFSSICGTVEALFMVTFYVNFFRTFYPEHLVVASIFSVLGLFPFFAIAIRKRKAVDYNEFIKERYKQFYTANGFNPYNPYNDFNRNDGNGGVHGRDNYGADRENGEPFSSFGNEEKKSDRNDGGDKDGEPFDDIFKNKGDK